MPKLFSGARPALERRTPHFDAPAVRAEAPAAMTMEQLAAEVHGVGASFAGPAVTAESSMRTAAVYSCVRLITGAIASLPLPVYQRDEKGDRQQVDGHPYDDLLNLSPNVIMTAAVFWKYMVAAELLGGDQIAIIGRRNAYSPEAVDLVPVDPRCVIVERRDKRLVYFILGPDGEFYGLDQDDVFHVPGEGFNGKRGMSVIGWAAKQAIGLALATEEHSARFFSNGARPDVVIKYPGKVNRDTADFVREYWLQRHQGTVNSHLPAVLPEGGEVSVLSMSAEDTQLLESRKFQVIDIARAFGVPPVMIGESEKTSSWGSGVEQMALWFVKFTLVNHLTKIRQELNRKLLHGTGYFVEHNVEGLLRGDSKSRSEFYRNALGGAQGPGWMTVNEARRRENLPPVPGGDKLFVPNQSTPAGGGSNEKPA